MPRESEHTFDASMSFGDHLEELRWRLILALAAPIPIAIGLFFVSARLIEVLLGPLYRVLAANNLPTQVQVLSPPEFLLTQIKLSIIFALIIASPWVIYQAWRFIGPGLYRHERRFVYVLLPGSAILTTIGMLLLYFIMLPLMLQVLVMFGSSLREPTMILQPAEAVAEVEPAMVIDIVREPPVAPVAGQMWLQVPENMLHIAVPRSGSRADSNELEILRLYMGAASRVAQQFRLSEYVSFVLLLMLAMTIAFQMPLVILLLGWMGMVSPQWLRKNRRYALAGCAVVAAVITPADAVSMLIMLVPLYALYELGILLLVFAPAKAVAAGTLMGRGGDEERNPYDRRDSD
jgi:sec-independent protein translocase protein TatC